MRPIALLCMCFCVSCFRSKYLPAGAFHVSGSKDTAFIEREKTKEYYHKVYIEQNRHSPFYKGLTDFKLDKYELPSYLETLEYLKQKSGLPLKKYQLQGLPKEWVPLYLYKGRYYVYYPSDAGNMGRRMITDSTMVYWFMDGITPARFSSATKLNDHTWYFHINSYLKTASVIQDIPDPKLTIHIIDPVNKIAVWEDVSQPLANRYELYIPKESIKNFDMIVNYCEQNKTAEFVFDKINYLQLLQGH